MIGGLIGCFIVRLIDWVYRAVECVFVCWFGRLLCLVACMMVRLNLRLVHCVFVCLLFLLFGMFVDCLVYCLFAWLID